MSKVGNAVDVLASFRGCLVLDKHCEVYGFMGDWSECRAFVVCAGYGNDCIRAIISKELSIHVGWIWERS